MTTTPTIDVVFDGPPAPQSGRFVETEIEGRGVRAGDWEERSPFWLLRIPDLTNALSDLAELGAVELFSAEVGATDWHRPDGCPWTITVDGSPHGWSGQNPSEAIFEAWRDLATLAK